MSPLDTEAVHEGGDVEHLLTIVLVRGDHLGLASDGVLTSQLIRGDSKTVSNRLGTRESRGLQVVQGTLRFRVQAN
jgi:hypothetical protein